MLKDIPTADDFYNVANELYQLSWDIISDLLNDFYYGRESGYTYDIDDEYWGATRTSLLSVLTITGQAVELALKGILVEISPYLILSDFKIKENTRSFNEIHTVGAQELLSRIKIFSDRSFHKKSIEEFNKLRLERNKIMHSTHKDIDKNIKDIILSLLSTYRSLFPDRRWFEYRVDFLQKNHKSKFYDGSGKLAAATYAANKELYFLIETLENEDIIKFFEINPQKKTYLCPSCDEKTHCVDELELNEENLFFAFVKDNNLRCPICNLKIIIYGECKDCGELLFSNNDGKITCENGCS